MRSDDDVVVECIVNMEHTSWYNTLIVYSCTITSTHISIFSYYSFKFILRVIEFVVDF